MTRLSEHSYSPPPPPHTHTSTFCRILGSVKIGGVHKQIQFCTVECILKNRRIRHNNMVSQNSRSLGTGSFTLICGTFCQKGWSFKTGGLSWQWSLKTGFTVLVLCNETHKSIYQECAGSKNRQDHAIVSQGMCLSRYVSLKVCVSQGMSLKVCVSQEM